ncbi:MAG: LamG domain-containing protein, partial [Planctomycetota bacterium]
RTSQMENWTRYAGQQSMPVTLEAGRKYYIEAVMKENAGGDRLRVAYGPAGAQMIIPGTELSPYDPCIATDPSPADGGRSEQDRVGLGWSAGPSAVEHDVYFGESYDDVDAGVAGTAKGRVTDTFYFAIDLTLGKTYYWRIDEIDADGTTHTGEVWSFTVNPPSAHSPEPADRARWVDTNADLTWGAGHDAILHRVYFGDNETDVANGTGDTDKGQQGTTTFDPGALQEDKTYYWRVDESDGITTHTGDVWRFRTIPTIPIYDPNLVGWWKFDDEGTGTVIDYSGYGRHGTIYRSTMWVPGADGDALEFNDRHSEYVTINGYMGVLGSHSFSITAWIRTRDNGEIVNWGNSSNGQRVEFRTLGDRLRCENGGGDRFVEGETLVDDDEWHHVAVTVIEGATPTYPGEVTLYLDGEDDTMESEDTTPFNIIADDPVTIGRRHNTGGRWYWGAIDDVRIYDKVLTQEEIQQIMLRPDTRSAWAPSPTDGAMTDVERAVPLSWSPGDFAAHHDVYFGIDDFAVADADTSDTTGIYRGRQDLGNETYNPAETLEYNQTYYWRIDQVNTDGTLSRGRVWSFVVGDFLIVDDFEAYDNGENQIWYAWKDGLGYGQPDAPPFYAGNGSGAAVGDETTESYAEETIIHGGEKSIPFFYDNNKQGYLNYSESALTLSPPRDWTRKDAKALSLWFRGYLESASSFTEAPTGTLTVTARSGDVFGQSDQFNYVFKQLTGSGSIIAKVESTTNTSASAKVGVMIRETLDPASKHAFTFMRPDGGVRFNRRTETYGDTMNSVENDLTLPRWVKLEREISGLFTASHSADGINWVPVNDEAMGSSETIQMSAAVYIGLAVSSNNMSAINETVFSNISTTGSVTGAWQSQDVGIPSNDPEPLYVAVANNSGTPVVVYHDDPNAARIDVWTEWNIDLKEFADQGINLSDVNSIAIGLGDRNNPQPGGSGKMYFDDIRLYPPRCVPELVKPAGDFSNNCIVDMADLEIMAENWLLSDYDFTVETVSDANLVMRYEFEGNSNDSSGSGNHGEPNGVTFVSGNIGQAVELDGVDDYVAIRNINYANPGHTQASVCAWIRTINAFNQAIVSFDRNEYWRLEINGDGAEDGQVGWCVMTNSGQADFGSRTRVDDGLWHHVTGVFDNGRLIVFIDGILDNSTVAGTTFGTGNTRYGFVGT